MGARTRAGAARVCRGGFTLTEVLVTIVVAGIVLGAVYQLVISQGHSYRRQVELVDVQLSLRAAATLLVSEIRHVDAAGGDLYAITPTAIAVRSSQASGVICAEHGTLARFGLVKTAGEFSAAADDSALVYARGAPGASDDDWRTLKIQAVGTGPAMGVGSCAWASGAPVEVGVELVPAAPQDTAGVKEGAPVIAFRRVEYALFEEDGRWWLGRKVGGAATYDNLTGPFLSPAAGGLEVAYEDAGGTPATDPTQVEVIRLVLRAESYRRARTAGTVQFVRDSIAVRIALRG